MKDNDFDIDKLYKESKESLYKALGFIFIICLTGFFIALICWK